MKECYISLLEKFEVALKISPNQMIIPSLTPEKASYPKPADDALFNCPPLRRFWLADFIPDGFWPRLICRVTSDQQIAHVGVLVCFCHINMYVIPHKQVFEMIYTEVSSPSSSANSKFDWVPPSPSRDRDTLNWTPWKTGMAFSYHGHTLMVIKQESNEPSDKFFEKWQFNLTLLKAKYRIEAHIYINEWMALSNSCGESFISQATKLVVMISMHVKSLATNWFPKMLISSENQSFSTHIPCWKCYVKNTSLNSSPCKYRFL